MSIMRWMMATTLAALAPLASAQTSVSATAKFAWGENIGWLNFADANGRLDGVRLRGTYLEGFVWGENVGWISVGQGGLPPMGSYPNTDGSTHGVNVEPNGDLSGYAWGENIGWINFDTRPTLAGLGQQARYDAAARRLRGYAWGENVGWINLDDGSAFVGFCAADLTTTGSGNGLPDGVVDISDYSFFLTLWSMGDARADVTTTGTANGMPDGVVDISDFSFYLTLWSTGCP